MRILKFLRTHKSLIKYNVRKTVNPILFRLEPFWKCYLTCLNWTYHDILLIKFKADLNPGGYSLQWPPIRRGSTRKGYHFQALSIWEGWDFTCWSIWKDRETVISVGKKAQKVLTNALHGCEKSWVNGLVLWFIPILKAVHLQQLRGMQISKLGL